MLISSHSLHHISFFDVYRAPRRSSSHSMFDSLLLLSNFSSGLRYVRLKLRRGFVKLTMCSAVGLDERY